jgi:phospholipid/cholesterol/gamma-HCH transport system substrate-binding protein
VYTLHLDVPSADGLWLQSDVKLAGVEVGAISAIGVAGDHAALDLAIRSDYQLPTDTTAEIRSSGIIGDRYIALYLGDDGTLLADDDVILLRSEPADFEKITKQVEDITTDVSAITQVLREMAEDDTNRRNIEATIANVEALSDELRQIAEQNHQDVDAIVDSVRRLMEGLEGLTSDTTRNMNGELEKLQAATDTLQASLDNVESVTGKIDRGEGTLGALVNDRETVDALNETIDNANRVIEGFSGMHSTVYYTGRWYMGTPAPVDPFYYGNPLAGTGSNSIGLLLKPQEDFWYNFEVVDYPQGTITYTEHFFPETGQLYKEYEREPNYRFTFMMNKRWFNLGLRLGIKENGGGLGASYWLFHDHLELQGDLFDFDLGSYPAVASAGIPNLRLLARYHPIDHLYVEVGNEQLFLGLQYGFVTGFVGGGFYFDDDDIKLLLATLPLNF